MRLQFGLEAYKHRASSLAAQRVENCFLEKLPQNAKNPVALLGSYGILDKGIAGAGQHRGGIVVKGIRYVVTGNRLLRVNADLSSTDLGYIPNSDRVSIAGDGVRVMVVSGRSGFVWPGTGTTVTMITDSDFPGAEWVAYLDGYFIVGLEGSIYISDPFDPLSWNALDFANAEASPDDIVGGIVQQRELFLGGQDSFEVFVNTGDQDFPLERVPSGFSEIGLLSRYGLAKIDNSVFFPATDNTVRRMNGYTPVIISTPFITQQIEALDTLDRASLIGMAWSEGSHSFYGLTCAKWSYAYDCSTQLWIRKRSYLADNWRVSTILNVAGDYLAFDTLSARMGQLSPEVYAEWDSPLILLATAQVVEQDNARITGSMLEVVAECGVGLNIGQGSQPQMMMRQSFNGGRTWTSERWRNMGAIGEFKRRCRWARIGQGRDRSIEVSISDPTLRALVYGKIDAEAGTS